MPLIDKLFNLRSPAWRKFVKAGVWRTAKTMSRVAGTMKGTKGTGIARAGMMSAGAATDISVLLTKLSGRVLGKGANALGRHPIAFATLGTFGLGGVGAAKGMTRMAASVQPTYPSLPRPGRMGLGYESWARPVSARMRPSDIGADGQLALALHRTRHR